jgi:hypothetical protein
VSNLEQISCEQARELRINSGIAPVDLREGFGWRVATPAFVERWGQEEAARGYRVLWNRFGDMLVSYWPAAKQAADAAKASSLLVKTRPRAAQRSGSWRDEPRFRHMTKVATLPAAKQPQSIASASALPFTETIDPETGEITTTPAAARGPHGRRRRRKAPRSPGLSANTVIVPGDGRPCPRCERPMQIREHREIGENELRQPSYYALQNEDDELRKGSRLSRHPSRRDGR